MQCCEARLVAEPTRYQRESSPEDTRRLPKLRLRQAQLEAQGHRCLYCLRTFGSFSSRWGRLLRLRVHWDHMVPYAYNQDNRAANFAAACQVCNLLKGDRCFGTIEEARVYLATRRETKGYPPL